MADQFDENGYNSGDFKRNSDAGQMDNNLQMEQDGEDGPKLNEKAGEYMRELLNEKIKLNNQKFPVSCRLLDQEVAKVQTTGRIPAKDAKYLDVFREKPVKVTVKVLVPVKEHPKFNFVGKLLGPKGNTMKQMQEETMCKMAVLGRGSMRDRRKEEELRNSLDPKYSHLTDELHVEISALAPPAEAHARIAYALAEVKKYLIPDNMDMMRQTQMRDIMDRAGPPRPPPGRGPPRMPPAPPMPHAHAHAHGHGHAHAHQHQHRGPMPGKAKVVSILDRARSAMESSYGGYDDPYSMPPDPPVSRAPRGPPRAPEQEFYYERAERFYDDEPYYKDEAPREFKSSRDVGTRRPPRYRHEPYARPAK